MNIHKYLWLNEQCRLELTAIAHRVLAAAPQAGTTQSITIGEYTFFLNNASLPTLEISHAERGWLYRVTMESYNDENLTVADLGALINIAAGVGLPTPALVKARPLVTDDAPPSDYFELTSGTFELRPVEYKGKWYAAAVNENLVSDWMIVENAVNEVDAGAVVERLVEECWCL